MLTERFDIKRMSEAEIRQAAARAAKALREHIAARRAGSPRPEPDEVIHADARPQYWWMYRWKHLPGLSLTLGGSTRSRKASKPAFTHDLLPRWEYLQRELPEMIDDLEALAAGKGQPTEATRTSKA
jgi:cytochrome P450